MASFSKLSGVKDVHIVWLTAGLSCDGDSVSVTAAEQPSIEDVCSATYLVCRKFTCTILSSLAKMALEKAIYETAPDVIAVERDTAQPASAVYDRAYSNIGENNGPTPRLPAVRAATAQTRYNGGDQAGRQVHPPLQNPEYDGSFSGERHEH